MLEVESGRIKLVEKILVDAQLVTGVIVGVLGADTGNGEFEVVDLCFAGMARQAGEDDEMDIEDIGSTPASEAQTRVLTEYLTGACGDLGGQHFASQISRLVILGNSLAPLGPIDAPANEDNDKEDEKPSTFFQVNPRAMFGPASSYSSFSCETNPTYLRLAPGMQASDGDVDPSGSAPTRTILATSGQPLNDMSKYVPTAPTTRLDLAEATLKWRHMAPTAPDTLWCHPFFALDPFIISQTPDIYAIGCQPRFATRLVKDGNRRSRVVLVPSFPKLAYSSLLV
ncbi:DNA polymerase alpha/epsilon subunit B-domain-containing protein [Lactarius sanguifluus]|nr:DNA polymerase alpha/epsilon subunit B-domain-containing protein [Lactarius sanguifluus]